MKGKVPFFLFITLYLNVWEVKSTIDEIFKQDIYNIYTHVVIEARDVEKPVTKNDVTYFLFTHENEGNGTNKKSYTEIDSSNPKELGDRNVRPVFLIHGWLGTTDIEWYQDVTKAFLQRKEKYNVVQVYWSDPSNQLYSISSYNTYDVGNFIGEFVVGLHKNYSIPLENFIIIGHSLGGQVTGFVGKKVQELLNRKLHRIVALDPAGPLFNVRPEEKRINRNDAEVVEVIHSNGGTFGFKDPCGTIDFFPNGGSSQSGCTKMDFPHPSNVTELIFCNHIKSIEYFVEALGNSEGFLATKCSSWSRYKALNCQEELKVPMGDWNTKATGNFYFETNSEPPFSKKMDGCEANIV